MAKVLITGGAGFIGRHVVRQFLKQGWQVVVFDLQEFDEPESGDSGSVESFRDDINSTESLREAMHACDAVVHLAAVVSVPQSIQEPEKTLAVNVDGTRNVLKYALDVGVSSVVVASSAAVYGSCTEMPLEESAPVECLSPYAQSKATNEEDVMEFRKKGLNAIALRFFNVYGPGQRPDSSYASLIPIFVHTMKNGKRPTIHGSGEQTRDFVHVHDLATAVYKMVERTKPYEHPVANVASETQISVLDVVQCINQGMSERTNQKAIVPHHGEARKGDVMHSCGSTKRLRSMIDWKASISFEQGIGSLLEKKEQRR
ncbi:MAG: NAD-dependent epimerase/dehydratase family protein [Candidatus Poseidoniales archaeon]